MQSLSPSYISVFLGNLHFRFVEPSWQTPLSVYLHMYTLFLHIYVYIQENLRYFYPLTVSVRMYVYAYIYAYIRESVGRDSAATPINIMTNGIVKNWYKYLTSFLCQTAVYHCLDFSLTSKTTYETPCIWTTSLQEGEHEKQKNSEARVKAMIRITSAKSRRNKCNIHVHAVRQHMYHAKSVHISILFGLHVAAYTCTHVHIYVHLFPWFLALDI